MLTFQEKITYRNAIRKGYAYYLKNERRHSLCGAFIRKHPNRVFVLEMLRRELGHYPEWNDLTDLALMDFKKAMSERYVANSCKVYFAELKALVHEYDESCPIPCKKIDKILAIKKEPSQAVYLTVEELRRLHQYRPTTLAERITKRVFMVECLTGARHEDAAALRITNCTAEDNMLTYVAQKTKMEVRLPVHKWLRNYLGEADLEENQAEVSLSQQNEIIRRMCCAVNIKEEVTLFRRGETRTAPKWEFVSSHTGRRSFATNLFLLGSDPYVIARFMGHANPDTTTKNYIIGYRSRDENAYKFFDVM